MGSRRTARELCLQALYLTDNCGLQADEAWHAAITEQGDDAAKDFGRGLLDGVLARKSELDALIARYSHNWKLERMASVDRNILRLAAYELVAMPQTPAKVIINEAVEIAKKYSTEDSGKFVNGILDQLKAERPSA